MEVTFSKYLVETGIFYVALFDNKSDVVFNESKLKNKENILYAYIIPIVEIDGESKMEQDTK